MGSVDHRHRPHAPTRPTAPAAPAVAALAPSTAASCSACAAATRPSCACCRPACPAATSIAALIERSCSASGRGLGQRACASRASWCSSGWRCSTSSTARRWPTSPRAMTELAEITLDCALAAGPRRAGRALRRAAQRRRPAHRLLGRRHGQARRARAERVVRHRPGLRLRGRRRRPTAPQPISAHEYFAQVARSLYALIGDDHRGRLRVPRRPGAAAERQLGPAGRQPGDAGGVPPGAGPRVGALRLAEEPRGRAARAASKSGRALALRGAGHRLRLPPLPRLRRVRGAAPAARARSATRRSAAPPAGPSAPTTSSCRAAASARSSSSCSCCWWCAAASSPRSAPARR